MDDFSSQLNKPSIIRIARKAGIKSMSDDCFPCIRGIISSELENIIKHALIVNSQKQTKTLMMEDVYDALELLGINLAKSNEMGITTITK